jgi:hypothetical protein
MVGQTAPSSNGPPTSANPPPNNPCDVQAQQKIAAARQEQAGSALMSLNPYWAISLGPELIRKQQITFDMIERERQRCHQNAEAAVARQAQEARSRE